MEGGEERKLNDGPATANQLTGWGRGGKADQNLLEIGLATNYILSYSFSDERSVSYFTCPGLKEKHHVTPMYILNIASNDRTSVSSTLSVSIPGASSWTTGTPSATWGTSSAASHSSSL